MLTREGERVGDLRPDRAGDDARRLDEMTARDWLDAHVDGGTRSLVGRALQVASELTHGVSAERLSAAALVTMIADAAIAPAATKEGDRPLDPWTGGSYLAFRPGQFTRYWGVLAKPEGRIHFAGEHTQTTGQGYLDGAVESGERAAHEVLDDFGLPFVPASAGG